MQLTEVREQILTPALAMLPPRFNTPAAVVMLLAIGLQESRFLHRKQINGPARGFWQFEQGGGVRAVLEDRRTSAMALDVCTLCGLGVSPSRQRVYEALAENDVLAGAFARLFLWQVPGPLPALGDAEEAWEYYLSGWRPGKPHRHTWDKLYNDALAEVVAV